MSSQTNSGSECSLFVTGPKPSTMELPPVPPCTFCFIFPSKSCDGSSRPQSPTVHSQISRKLSGLRWTLGASMESSTDRGHGSRQRDGDDELPALLEAAVRLVLPKRSRKAAKECPAKRCDLGGWTSFKYNTIPHAGNTTYTNYGLKAPGVCVLPLWEGIVKTTCTFRKVVKDWLFKQIFWD